MHVYLTGPLDMRFLSSQCFLDAFKLLDRSLADEDLFLHHSLLFNAYLFLAQHNPERSAILENLDRHLFTLVHRLIRWLTRNRTALNDQFLAGHRHGDGFSSVMTSLRTMISPVTTACL